MAGNPFTMHAVTSSDTLAIQQAAPYGIVSSFNRQFHPLET